MCKDVQLRKAVVPEFVAMSEAKQENKGWLQSVHLESRDISTDVRILEVKLGEDDG